MVVIVNFYSTFGHADIRGPKSLITILKLFADQPNTNITLLINSKNKQNTIGKFAFENNIMFFSGPLNLFRCLRAINKKEGETVVLFDRANIILPLLISKIYNWKTCLRLLGRANRLNSTKLLGYRSFLKYLTLLFPINLVIETLDGSQTTNTPLCFAHEYIDRFNGIPLNETKYGLKKDAFLFVNVARFATEKDIVSVVEAFAKVREYNWRANLHIFGVTLEQFLSLSPGKLEMKGCVFHGYASEEEICQCLSKSSHFITGNTLGLLGNAELEAIGFDCKIINATNHPIGSLPLTFHEYFISVDEFLSTNTNKIVNLNRKKLPSFEDVHRSDLGHLLNLFKNRSDQD